MTRSLSIRRVGLAALATLLLGAATGCSTDSSVVARIGDRTITVGEFRALAASAAGRYPMPPDTAKRMLLDDIIRRELMVVAARTNPSMVDTLISRHREGVEQDALSRALAEQVVPPIAVSDAEIAKLYEQRATETHCQLVFTPDLNSIRNAWAAIKRGEEFGMVAHRYDVGGMLPPGGDLGFVTAGDLVNPLDRIVRTTPVGGVVGPIPSPGEGWFIVKIVQRRPHPQPPFAIESPRLREMLTQRKQRMTLVRSYQSLTKAYDLQTDEDGVRALFNRFGAPQMVRQMGGEPPPTTLSPSEQKVVLARWNGGGPYHGVFTLHDAAQDLDRGYGQGINASSMLSFEQWAKARALQRVAMMEARRRHLDQDPAVAQQIEQQVNSYIVEGLYNAEVAQKSEATGPDLQAAYERNLAALGRLRTVHVQYMTFPESANAVTAMSHLRGGTPMRDAILLSSPSLQVRDEIVTYPTPDTLWTRLELAFSRQASGAIIGPIRVGNGWRIVQVLERDSQAPPLDQLSPDIRQALITEAQQAARDRRLLFYTDSLRRVIPVTVNAAVLARVRWPSSFASGLGAG